MRWFLLVVAFACCSLTARAEERYKTILTSGEWSAQALEEKNGVKTCDVIAMKLESMPWGSLVFFSVSAVSDQPTIIKFAISIPKLAFSPREKPVLVFRFDGKTEMLVPAVIDGPNIAAQVVSDTLIPWMHAFTAGQRLSVSLQGRPDDAISFSLAGTTTTINAMSDCTKNAGFKSLPLPFTRGVTAGGAAAAPPPFPEPADIPAYMLASVRSEGDPQDIPVCDDGDAVADIRGLLENSSSMTSRGNKLLDIGPIKRQKTSSGLMVCSLIVVTAQGDFNYLAYYYRKYGKIYIQTVRFWSPQ
jgi:hypothetical protein